MGILLRADPTGHSNPTLFGRNWLIGWFGHVLSSQPSKGHPWRILILFPYCYTTLVAPHIKIFATYFALFIFLDFCTVCNASPDLSFMDDPGIVSCPATDDQLVMHTQWAKACSKLNLQMNIERSMAFVSTAATGTVAWPQMKGWWVNKQYGNTGCGVFKRGVQN